MSSDAGMDLLNTYDVSRALVAEKIAQIGVKFAEIASSVVTLIENAIAYDFIV